MATRCEEVHGVMANNLQYLFMLVDRLKKSRSQGEPPEQADIDALEGRANEMAAAVKRCH